jgi:hypothetical protein
MGIRTYVLNEIEHIKGSERFVDFILDRGNLKWTTMMLTEHRVALKQLQQEVEDVPEPERTEDELTEIAEIIGRALKQGLVVEILHFRSKRYHQIKGKVVGWDQATQSIIMDQGTAIPVRCILKVEQNEWE